MALARRVSEQVLADRAIDGIEEEVWFRGELAGTRRRYDSRLLLAHLARLDRHVEARPFAEEDADRFDELLAVMIGEQTPGGEEPHLGLPLDCDDFAEVAAEAAQEQVEARWIEQEGCKNGKLLLGVTKNAAYKAECLEAAAAARVRAGQEWAAWRIRACEAADRVLDRAPLPPSAPTAGGELPATLQGPRNSPARTVSTVSTPPVSPAG